MCKHVLAVLGISFSSPRERIEFQKKTRREIIKETPSAIIEFVQIGKKAKKKIERYKRNHPAAIEKRYA